MFSRLSNAGLGAVFRPLGEPMQRLPSDLTAALRLPIIAAPMFLVSGPDLVIASCRAGIIGAFPTANCRTLDDLDRWLTQIVAETNGTAPFAAILIVHCSNNRLQEDTELVAKHRTPFSHRQCRQSRTDH